MSSSPSISDIYEANQDDSCSEESGEYIPMDMLINELKSRPPRTIKEFSLVMSLPFVPRWHEEDAQG